MGGPPGGGILDLSVLVFMIATLLMIEKCCEKQGDREENEDFHLFLDQDKTVLKCPSGLKGVFPGKKTLEISDIGFFQC